MNGGPESCIHQVDTNERHTSLPQRCLVNPSDTDQPESTQKQEMSSPKLSCQELSKQCNNINSESHQAPTRWYHSSCRRNIFSSLQTSRNNPEDRIGPGTDIWDLDSEDNVFNVHAGPCDAMCGLQSATGHFCDDDGIFEDIMIQEDTTNEAYTHPDFEQSEEGFCKPEWPHTCEENQDILDEIESSLHYQVDSEIEAFRSNLHSIIVQQQLQCRHLRNQEQEESSPSPPAHQQQSTSPVQRVPQTSGSDDTWSSDFMQSTADQQKLEAMSTSTSSLQDEETGIQFIPTSGVNGPLLEEQLNKLTIQLLTSALIISNTLQREEYTT